MSTLVQPSPLPDEIDRGYLGRIMRINGYRNAKDVVEAMSADYGEGTKSRRELTTHEILSNMAGLTSEEFAKNHTTIPLRRAITSFFPEIRHGSLERRSLLHNGAMQRKYAAAFLCEECVKADIHFHGVSYWRRDHQTPGQLWCQKHEKPLHFSISVDPLLSSPAQFVGCSEVVPLAWVTESQKNAFVQRYLDISTGVFDRSTPFGVSAIAPLLRDVGKAQGFQTYAGKVKSALVSDRIQEVFPSLWLGSVFRELVAKQKGSYMPQVDGALYMRKSSSSATAYFLVLAVLFDSTDEALNALRDACDGTYGVKPLRQRSSRHDKPDDETLVQSYVNAKGCHTRVAQSLKLPRYLVTDALDDLGLPNLTFKSVGELTSAAEGLISFYVKARPFMDSLDASGISLHQFESLLRKCGPRMPKALDKMHPQSAPRARGRQAKSALPRNPDPICETRATEIAE